MVPRKNSIPQCAFEMLTIKVSAIQAKSHSLLCSSSIHEPSDPPHRIVIIFTLHYKNIELLRSLKVFIGWIDRADTVAPNKQAHANVLIQATQACCLIYCLILRLTD